MARHVHTSSAFLGGLHSGFHLDEEGCLNDCELSLKVRLEY